MPHDQSQGPQFGPERDNSHDIAELSQVLQTLRDLTRSIAERQAQIVSMLARQAQLPSNCTDLGLIEQKLERQGRKMENNIETSGRIGGIWWGAPVAIIAGTAGFLANLFFGGGHHQ